MSMEKYSIGGTMQETDANEGFNYIPQNRVLLAEKLTALPSGKPEIIEGLTSVEQVFGHFKPTIHIELETEEGTIRNETLQFRVLDDFGIKGISSQSSLLNELTLKKDQYQKIIRQLKTNKVLRQALSDKQTKEHIVQALYALIQELEESR